MEVDEGIENKKKLDEQSWRLPPAMDQMFRDSQKEKWKEKLLEIEEKRNELLEH